MTSIIYIKDPKEMKKNELKKQKTNNNRNMQ